MTGSGSNWATEAHAAADRAEHAEGAAVRWAWISVVAALISAASFFASVVR